MLIEILCIAVVAVVYADILTDTEMLLEGLYGWLRDRLPDWLFKPLIGCSKCFSGQLALWWFIFTHDFELPLLVVFVSGAIFSTVLLRWVYLKIRC